MHNNHHRWGNDKLRKHVEVLNGTCKPHIILKNANYLNTYVHEWLKANIWIYEDRIIYVGADLPEDQNDIEIIDCSSKYLVPGYMEPHSHPFQLYNPLTLAEQGGQFGTTTIINDNLTFLFELSTDDAFRLLDKFSEIPASIYWWSRLDGQTELPNNAEIFNDKRIISWIENKHVLQGGELTGWPKLLNGYDQYLSWIQHTKTRGKKVEGHFPGASERTLAKLKLLGADCDHEAMTGEEALVRLMQGYTVSLRNSSIRPDLEILLTELIQLKVQKFDKFFFTTDGSHPYFYECGMTDKLIRIAINCGVPVIDAYMMASYNIANHYNMEHLHGSIATGRIANINILKSKEDPTPVSVLAKGVWIKKDGENTDKFPHIVWEKYNVTKRELDWELTDKDFVFTNTIGIQLINNVISKPYEIQKDQVTLERDECYLMMVAKDGSWRVNTVLKGFVNQLGGLASSYSGTGDILIIGKNKTDMLLAVHRLKQLGGGIVLYENSEMIHEIHLPLFGIMSNLSMDSLIQEEKVMIKLLKERGYDYDDPAFTLLFLSATHLPFIRITPSGIIDVKKNKVIAPPTKRELNDM